MPIDLKAIRERETKATRGPWTYDTEDDDGDSIRAPWPGHDDGCIAVADLRERMSKNDRDFVLAAREDVPALLDLVEELKAALFETAKEGCARPGCSIVVTPRGNVGYIHDNDCPVDAVLRRMGIEWQERPIEMGLVTAMKKGGR